MDIVKEIWTKAEAQLTDPGQFVVDVVVSARKGPKKVLVILDGDQGVSIDNCADMSRALSKLLDDAGYFEDNYTLEVSTPGVDHPLKFARQYAKHTGRRLKVKMAERTVEGKLESVTDEGIVLSEETGTGKKKEIITTAITFSQIEKAFVLVSFK